MPFLAPIAAAAVAFAGTFIGQIVISVAISIGSSFLAKKLAEDKRKTSASATGAKLEIEYGEDTPRQVAIGLCASAGSLVYDNTYGSANKNWQRVLKLADFRCTSLTRVAVNGEWVTLGTLDATMGYPVTSGEGDGFIWVKFIDGSQTTADTYLTGNDNPDGRWSTDHIGNDVCYVIVTMVYDREDFNSAPEFIFEFEGAPLYDWRLDDTNGGTGPHRFDDVTTWEYSANPILADYCYRRGFYTGTYATRDVFCGMNMPASDLPVAKFTAAANICEETVDSEDRYVVSIFLDATRQQHGDNIENLLASCAGQAVDSVSGSYPLIGTTLTPVATLSDADMIAGAPRSFQKFRSMSELVNTVSGTYIEPDFVYAATGYDEQTTGAAVTLDRRTLDFNLNFGTVPSKRQAEQLASIYFSENRFQATKNVTVQEKWQVLEVGDWITWSNDSDGAATRDYQIMAMSIASLDDAPQRHVNLSLQERDTSIYSDLGPVTPPVAPTPNDPPSYLAEVTTFSASAIQVEADDGLLYPAILTSWDAITDDTVVSVLVQWRVKDATDINSKSIDVTVTNTLLQEAVVGSTVFEVRTRLITEPPRATTATAWTEVTTDAPPAVTIDLSSPNLSDTFVDIVKRLDNLDDWIPLHAAASMVSVIDQEDQIENTNATVTQNAITAATDSSANAASILLVEASVDDVSAEGLFAVETNVAPGSYDVRLSLIGRITAGGATEAAGMYIDLEDVGGGSIDTRIVLQADQVQILNSDTSVAALFSSDQIALGYIPEITAGQILAGTITADEIVVNGLTDQVSVFVADNERVNTSSTGWVDLDALEVDVVVGRADTKVLIHTTSVLTNTANQVDLRILIDGNWYPYGIKGSWGVASGGTPARIGQASINCIWEPRDDISLAENATANNRLWNAVVWSEDLSLFCAVGQTLSTTTNIMTSSNGTSWTARSHTSAYFFFDVEWCSSAGIFIALAGANGHTSTNGTTWTLRSSIGTDLRAVAWSETEGLMAAVGQSGEIRTSPDGITWTTRTSPYSVSWRAICYGDGKFVALSIDGGTGRVAYSTDGITWTGSTDAVALAGSWVDVCYSPELDLFCAVGTTSEREIMTSDDGVTWTRQYPPKFDYSSGDNEFWKVAWGDDPGLFVATSSGDTFAHGQVMTSHDGIDWREVASTSDESWRGVAYSPSLNKFSIISNNDDKSMISTTVPAISTHTIKVQWGVSNSTGSAYSRSLSTLQFLR